jgi:hypothetical protein
MSKVIPVCYPGTDAGFGERVRRVVADDRVHLDALDGVALVQAVLRATYPLAAVVATDGVSAGGVRQTVVLDVYRDGFPGDAARADRWTQAVYERSGAAAYRAVVRILGEGAAAESVVERAFREVRRSAPADFSVEAGGAGVEAAAIRLANEGRAGEGRADGGDPEPESQPTPGLVGTSLRHGARRRALSARAVASLLAAQRQALELTMLEDLKVREAAERMRTTSSVVHRHLRDALLAVGSGQQPSASATLARWREAERGWAQAQTDSAARAERAVAVAHAWLDYQVAAAAVPADMVLLVTAVDRTFVATSAPAAQMFGRPSLVGLRIDDVTADYARPLVPELWTTFDSTGGMHGMYDCERPGQAPIRVPFHGVYGRPLPELQVGYLRPPVPVAEPQAVSATTTSATRRARSC